jgi:HSP20 family molecular chaperone IbpA
MADIMIRPAATTRRIFGDFLGFEPYRALGTIANDGFDISKTETGYGVELPVPGFGPDQIEVTVEDRVLTIVGKSERRNITRTLLLPEEIDVDTIEAKVEHGLLSLGLHVHPKAQPRKINVTFGK